MKTCTSCQSAVADGDHHCGYCGTALSAPQAAGATVLGMSPVAAAAPPGQPAPAAPIVESFAPFGEADPDDSKETVAMPALDPAVMAAMRRQNAPPSGVAAPANPLDEDITPTLRPAGAPVRAVAQTLRAPGAAPTPTFPVAPAAPSPPAERAADPVASRPVAPAAAPVAPRVASPVASPAPAPAASPAPAPAASPAPAPAASPAPAHSPGPAAPPPARPQDAATLIMESPLEELQAALAKAREEATAGRGPLGAGGDLAAPVTDFDDEAPPVVSGGGTGRTLALVGVIAVPLIGLLTAAVIFFGGGELRLTFDSRVAWDAERNQYQVTLGIVIDEGDPKEKLEIEFRGEKHPFEGNHMLTFKVPRGDLKVGVNSLPAVVRTPKGEQVGQFVANILVDYEFEVERTVLGPQDKGFTAFFRLAEGANLFVEGATVQPAGDGRVAVKVRLDDILSRIDTLQSPDYPYSMRFRILRADGSEVPNAQQVRLTLPSAPLDVLRPARSTVTAGKKIDVFGRSDPSATVAVAGRPVRLLADGTFKVRLNLEEGDNDIPITADMPGLVHARDKREVRRVTPEELAELRDGARAAAEDWAGKDALRDPQHPALLAGAEGELKGRKVVAKGVVSAIQQGPDHAVLLVDMCGADGACVVWAETKGPVLVDVGDKVTVFGALQGARDMPAESAGGVARQVPVVAAQGVVAD